MTAKNNMTEKEKIFKQTFGSDAEFIYRSPARINLIGEHIDYNGGMVLPAAISLYITAYVSFRDDDKICFLSDGFDKLYERKISDLEYDKSYGWANYGYGVFYTLIKKGFKIDRGLNVFITSEIPMGSGLSSSASLLDLVCYVVGDAYGLNLSAMDVILYAKETENDYCGLKCGIMDEAAIGLGKENKAIMLDCASLDYKYIDMDLGEYTFAILQTNVPHKLVESKYNDRVTECESALKILKDKYSVKNLCELPMEKIDEIKSVLSDNILFNRTLHCISENARVKEFAAALERKDIQKLGALLNESHESLKNLYEVTGKHLDVITDIARKTCAVGARMTGAGFGGCAIALIKKSDFELLKNAVTEEYYQQTGIMPNVYQVDIVSGPRRIK